ncbi:MAG TPA: hypothetical protein VHZ76_04555, partial [Gammaproteobacteria bacterium]|nr:hypothetical protein [Gammaproteobacteria bacterium]
MSTVNFSVPAEVKHLFNQVFAGQNKSQILSDLMKRAIQEQQQKEKRKLAIEQLLKLREKQKKHPVSSRAIH